MNSTVSSSSFGLQMKNNLRRNSSNSLTVSTQTIFMGRHFLSSMFYGAPIRAPSPFCYQPSSSAASSVIRWQSTNSNNNNGNGKGDDSNSRHRAFLEEQAKAQQEKQQQQQQQPYTETARERITAGAAAATHQLEQRLKMVVTELNLGDQLAVLLIAVFTGILLTAPYAVRHMKQAAAASEDDRYGDRLETEDFVDEFAKLARSEWGTEIIPVDGSTEDGGASTTGDSKNVVEALLKDVFKSAALQHAAQDFVVQILQSERFQEAVRRLVKELWSDLVSDPETVAQVVKLLEVAIQNPDIKNAVQELVLQVFVQEAEVREALIGMIQQLGNDDLVREAVVRLLTDSAHTTLNDPDILEHSMEFATDVVGDDIVQQTAGEALRKSVGHAVRPATTVLLAAAGVGFLIFGVVAIGYSRSSEKEAVLFETAARSLHSNATLGIMRILTWPLRALQKAVQRAASAVWSLVPGARASLVAYGEAALHRLGHAADVVLRYLAMQSVALPWRAIKATGRWLSAAVLAGLQIVGEQMHLVQQDLSTEVASLAVALWKGVVHWVQRCGTSSRRGWETASTTLLQWSQRVGEAGINGLERTAEYTITAFTRLVEALQSLWHRIVGKRDLGMS